MYFDRLQKKPEMQGFAWLFSRFLIEYCRFSLVIWGKKYIRKENLNHEDDISAEEEIQIQGTRIPQENEYRKRT